MESWLGLGYLYHIQIFFSKNARGSKSVYLLPIQFLNSAYKQKKNLWSYLQTPFYCSTQTHFKQEAYAFDRTSSFSCDKYSSAVISNFQLKRSGLHPFLQYMSK